MPSLRQTILACAGSALLTGHLAAQTFLDVTPTSGIQNVPLSFGGDGAGLCCADFDGDGDLDLVIPGSTGNAIQYFRNDGGMSFTELTSQLGLGAAGNARGALAADLDNDGDQDFLIANWRTPLQLFINAGNATFTEEAIARGLTTQTSAHSISFGDYDRDGWLDIHLANRELLSTSTGQANTLYRNTGNGHFVDVTAASGAGNLGLTYVAPFIDYNEDGWPDIYCANDKGVLGAPNTILHNNGDGTFSDIGINLNAAQVMDGMGVDFLDVFNDGGVDIFCSDNPVDHLFLRWDPTFDQYTDETYTYGLMGGGTGWAANWLDYDNDGWQDLHVVQNGQANLVFHNPGTPAAANVVWPNTAFSVGLAIFFPQYASMMADLDNDGGVDVVHRNSLQPLFPPIPGCTVHRNQILRGNWLKIKTTGVVSNRDGIGAKVEVVTGALHQRQEVRSGVGYLTGSDRRVHFGLGSATVVDQVTVTWPSGQVQLLDGVNVNQILEVVEPSFTLRAPVAVGGTSTLDLSIQGDEGLLYGMVLAFAETPRSQLLDGRYLPLQLDGLSSYTFIPGNVILSNPLNFLDGFGQASSLITIPNTQGLAGLPLFATAATVPTQGLPNIRTIFPKAVRIVIQ